MGKEINIEYPVGATPLSPDELDGLILSIGTQGELNELEKINIQKGYQWARKSRSLKKELLTYSGLLKLHKRLFGEIWEWAGIQRKSEKNIGVEQHQISQEIHKLCGDVQFWINNNTYDWDEIAVRFHHRLVLIHPFANGNGRFARIASDLLLKYYNCHEFTWGARDLATADEVRDIYIKALRNADRGDYAALIAFVRS